MLSWLQLKRGLVTRKLQLQQNSRFHQMAKDRTWIAFWLLLAQLKYDNFNSNTVEYWFSRKIVRRKTFYQIQRRVHSGAIHSTLHSTLHSGTWSGVDLVHSTPGEVVDWGVDWIFDGVECAYPTPGQLLFLFFLPYSWTVVMVKVSTSSFITTRRALASAGPKSGPHGRYCAPNLYGTWVDHILAAVTFFT